MKTVKQISVLVFLCVIALACGENKTSDKVEAPKKALHEATFFGDLESVKQHIAYGTDLNQKDDYGSTALITAITFGKNDIAKELIEGGSDLTIATLDGSTPLHAAALYGRVDIVRLLIEKGAVLDVKNSYQSTPAMIVSAPFDQMKPVYDQLSRDLGPMGFKLDYDQLQKDRETVAQILGEALQSQNQ